MVDARTPKKSFRQAFTPFVELIKEYPSFRRLWIAQAISNFGDWFGLLALYALVQRYSDSEFLLGLVIIVKMLSLALFSPIAGYLTDRFNRRILMIICDGGRALSLLLMLLVQQESLLWLAYALTGFQMMLSAIFEPAKTASIPNVAPPERLVDANIISTATWSIIFTSGMAIGGFATEWIGVEGVFILDAFTYLVSAWFIYRAVIPQEVRCSNYVKGQKKPSFWEDIRQNIGTDIVLGIRYLRDNHQILRPAVAKGTSTIFLGGLVYMLVLVSDSILQMGSIGLGLLYAARGIGTGIGPIIARQYYTDERQWVVVMGASIALSGAMYLVVGLTQVWWMMFVFVLLAHAASGANWVTSTVLLQKRSEDNFRGRVFSTEWLLFTLGNSLSVVVASVLLEWQIVALQTLISLYAVGLMAAGLLWLATVANWERNWVQKGLT
ncbi:MAG: MFS transporter [Rhodothermaeota bacterium MED-G12]|nr:MAG: MFS transporter [Rhodothermaeota bacterium MED-G12]CAI8320263.1 MAG: Putative bacilysin exporter BacE [Rhodothermaeota bacterium MED-G12]|tara:strand:- start:5715 stop:7031 length:1317 start_codon:yes stop_codon:yes gene_type:complete